jgi:hypothetical protein
MTTYATKWTRVGIVLSVLWTLAIAGATGYEWYRMPSHMEPEPHGFLVRAIIKETGEPLPSEPDYELGVFVSLPEEVVPQVRGDSLAVAIAVPIILIWLIGALLLWVVDGFRDEDRDS